MAKLRIGTFNLENLFLRYRLLDKERGSRTIKPVSPETFIKEGGHINQLGMDLDDLGPISKSLRQLTAKIILENAPDILAVQEVEGQEALYQFNARYLKYAYPYQLVIDGNDNRGIDVGILSRLPITRVVTHQFEPIAQKQRPRKIFARDCLEIGLETPLGEITVFNNHLTSRISDPDGTKRREPQANRILDIIRNRWKHPEKADWVIAGDFNALPDEPPVKLFETQLGAENLLHRVPEAERWTYIFKKNRQQIDYLLASPRLAKRSKAIPSLDRRGLPAAKRPYDSAQREYLAADGASDHCPIFWDLAV